MHMSKKYIDDRGNFILYGNSIDYTKRLIGEYKNKINCVYIDPPYNIAKSYKYYDDNLTVNDWLKMLEKIILNLYELLSQDGSLWISINDKYVHLLRSLCDNIFSPNRYIATIIWEHRKTRENRTAFSYNHEYILVYSKNSDLFAQKMNDLPITDNILNRYKNPDNDPRGNWQSVSLTVQDGHATKSQFYEVISPITSKKHWPSKGRCWAYNQERMLKEIENNNIWFGADGNSIPRKKSFLSDKKKGLTPLTIWTADEVGTTTIAKKEILSIFPNNIVFETPKPEKLIERILLLATNENELVLDAFLGSGTTAAVSYKMNRKYIGIEKEKACFLLACSRIENLTNN